MELKKITRLSMLITLSVVISIIELSIPGLNIAGFKLGLANIINIYVIYKYSFKDAIYVSIIRVLLVGLLFSGLFNITFFFSLGGSILSIIVMSLMKKIKVFGVVGVSVLGAIAHNIGQVIVGMIILNNTNFIYYLPYLLLFALPTGIIVGLLSKNILKYTKDI